MDKLTGFCDIDKTHILNGKFFVWKIESNPGINTQGLTLLLGVSSDITQYPAKDGFYHACSKGCIMKKLNELTDRMLGMKEDKDNG